MILKNNIINLQYFLGTYSGFCGDFTGFETSPIVTIMPSKIRI